MRHFAYDTRHFELHARGDRKRFARFLSCLNALEQFLISWWRDSKRALEMKIKIYRQSSFVAFSIIALFAQYSFFLLWLKQCWVCKYDGWRDVGEFSLESWSLRRELSVVALSSVRRLPLERLLTQFEGKLHFLQLPIASNVIESFFQQVITKLSSMPLHRRGIGWKTSFSSRRKSNTEQKKVIIRRCNRKGKTVCREPCWNEVENFPYSCSDDNSWMRKEIRN